LDPRAALTALAARLGELGVAIRYGLEAPARSPAGRQVVDCTGLAARGQLTDLRGVKGEMLLLRLRELSLSRPVRLLHPRVPVYVNGLYRHGFLIAPALARRAADVVLHGRHFPEVMDADPRQRRLA